MDKKTFVNGFRRVNPAASLKHAVLGYPFRRFPLGFRRVNPAASLKRLRHRAIPIHVSGVPAG